jgi:hypothetical protein
MKQQSINNEVIKYSFGVLVKDSQEIKEAISGLQKDEFIMKNPVAITLGIGKKFKKNKVNHLI